MAHNVLARWPEAERQRIQARAAAVAAHLHRWSGVYANTFNPARFPAMALTMATAAPWLPLQDLAALAELPIWIFAVDDLVDESDMPEADLVLRLGHYADVVADRRSRAVPLDPLARALADIRTGLARRRLSLPLWDLWSDQVKRMLMGMLRERRIGAALRAGATPPDLEGYLETALHSVGCPVSVTAAWMILNDPGVLHRLPLFLEAERHAAVAMRLANDLRTYEKELREGNLNALMLVGPQAEASLRRRIGEHVSATAALLARVTEGPVRAAEFLVRLTHFSVAFYAEHDFHTLPASSIQGL